MLINIFIPKYIIRYIYVIKNNNIFFFLIKYVCNNIINQKKKILIYEK